MIFVIGLFVLSGLFGTFLALRLQAIELQEGKKSILTRRGRVVSAVLVGIGVALFVFLLVGLWWECAPSGVCQYSWGY
jgi:uncharacterized membrane protein YqjE